MREKLMYLDLELELEDIVTSAQRAIYICEHFLPEDKNIVIPFIELRNKAIWTSAMILLEADKHKL